MIHFRSVVLIALFFCTKSFAFSYGVGVGAYNLGTTAQNDTSGGQATFSFDPGVSLNGVMNLSGNHFFNPDFGFVYHINSGDDGYGEQSKQTLYILWDFGYRYERFVLRYGLGTFHTRISGDGGAVTVRNGSGTSTAYRPEETVTSYNSTLNLGASYLATQATSVRFESYMFSFLNSKARSLYYSLSVHMFF